MGKLILLLLVVAVVWCGVWGYNEFHAVSDDVTEENLEKVHYGMSFDEVEYILGTPYQIVGDVSGMADVLWQSKDEENYIYVEFSGGEVASKMWLEAGGG